MTIAPAVLAPFVNEIAFITEQQPATTPQEFIGQLEIASERLADARINNAEDLDTAATYLSDAINATGAKRKHLTAQAVSYLSNARDMADEYRLMV
ncbi:MAG: hypothetical protein ACM3S1_01545 [Hyphomicrobiales bacterium]